MKKAKRVAVGDVVQFPAYEFAPLRRGWNGWIFRAAIIEKLFVSKKSGKKCATVRYCSRIAGRYQLLPNIEATKNVYVDQLFEFDVEFAAKRYKEFKAYEDSGEEVCWNEDTALLVNHGII